mgnify:CR=1 FL=1
MKRSRMPPRKAPMKRTEFKRKPGYQIPRGGKLRAKAKVSKRRRQMEADQVQFPKGVPFDEVRNYLPANPKDWPSIVRVIDKPAVRTKYLAFVREQGGVCPLCKAEPVSEVHHLVAGSRGRADERCALLGLGSRCHREIQSVVSEYRRCWLAKLEQDPEGCDWIRLVLLLGYWPAFESLDD